MGKLRRWMWLKCDKSGVGGNVREGLYGMNFSELFF